jgi:hypothetical protein
MIPSSYHFGLGFRLRAGNRTTADILAFQDIRRSMKLSIWIPSTAVNAAVHLPQQTRRNLGAAILAMRYAKLMRLVNGPLAKATTLNNVIGKVMQKG